MIRQVYYRPCHCFGSHIDRVLSKIYRLGEKFRVAKGQECSSGEGRGGGVKAFPPRNVLKRICAEMQSSAF